MTPKYEKLKTLLQELFQLDQPDLDFGLYRIMHAKSAEILQFLDKDLLPQVQEAFRAYASADLTQLQQDLAKAIEQARGLGADPDTVPKVQELRARIQNEAVDLGALEDEVYDRLLTFFRRYYSDGDFLAKRVYKPGVYAIPYEGEEVKLHWANADQYYIKTSEYLRDYTFCLRSNDTKDPMRVHFRLADATENEHGNVKAAEGEERRFRLAVEGPISIEAGELIIRFTYQPDTAKQKELNAATEQAILESSGADLVGWTTALSKPNVRPDGTPSGTLLRVHLERYTARNTFDYFVHKELGTFLRRELDFYIKNEVMQLDDVENETTPRVEQYLSKIKVIRRIASKIIDFLAQLEDFQKRLWLKKKFVVSTDYCIRIDQVPVQFYPEVLASAAQREEWIRLYGIDQLQPDLTKPGYSAPLTEAFLKAHPTLLLELRLFPDDFAHRVLDSFDKVDEHVDGLLVHAENYQALGLLERRQRGRVECIYIDPPYNTGDSEIPYKNAYLRSSWLSLMENRLTAGIRLLADDSVIFIAIDDFEMVNLAKLIDTQFPAMRREMIIVNHHPQGGKAKTLAHTHEYMITCVSPGSDRTFVGRASENGIELRPFKRSGTAESNFRAGRPNSFYAILVEPGTKRVVGLEPPPSGSNYPEGPTSRGHTRVYPISEQGKDRVERVWRRSYESGAALVEAGKLQCTENMTIYQVLEAHERTAALFSNWVDPRYNAGTFGANLLRDIIGAQNPFSYPKSIHTVEDAIFSAGLEEEAIVLDYFAGSGTTGHAVINLNREDGASRKFILIDNANYFDAVLVPRIKRITFAPEWKEGKPRRLATLEESERSPRMIKIVRLESYEDALNNLELRRTSPQQTILEIAETQGTNGFREQYVLRYMLDVESRGSQSLLNVEGFKDPTGYKLKVKRPGSDESRETTVDLLETFNWLVGLTVHHIAAPQTFRAGFERDSEKRLRLKGLLKPDPTGPWWFRTVTGTTPDGRRTLIIWRKLTGDLEQDNLVLEAWFTKQGYSTKDYEFQVIYVNGDNNLENLKAAEDTWKVRLIEEDFHRLMFDTQEL